MGPASMACARGRPTGERQSQTRPGRHSGPKVQLQPVPDPGGCYGPAWRGCKDPSALPDGQPRRGSSDSPTERLSRHPGPHGASGCLPRPLPTPREERPEAARSPPSLQSRPTSQQISPGIQQLAREIRRRFSRGTCFPSPPLPWKTQRCLRSHSTFQSHLSRTSEAPAHAHPSSPSRKNVGQNLTARHFGGDATNTCLRGGPNASSRTWILSKGAWSYTERQRIATWTPPLSAEDQGRKEGSRRSCFHTGPACLSPERRVGSAATRTTEPDHLQLLRLNPGSQTSAQRGAAKSLPQALPVYKSRLLISLGPPPLWTGEQASTLQRPPGSFRRTCCFTRHPKEAAQKAPPAGLHGSALASEHSPPPPRLIMRWRK